MAKSCGIDVNSETTSKDNIISFGSNRILFIFSRNCSDDLTVDPEVFVYFLSLALNHFVRFSSGVSLIETIGLRGEFLCVFLDGRKI